MRVSVCSSCWVQGVAHAHPVLYASTHPLPEEFLVSLPATTESREDREKKEVPATSGAQEVSVKWCTIPSLLLVPVFQAGAD
jgi:hypothetical protein